MHQATKNKRKGFAFEWQIARYLRHVYPDATRGYNAAGEPDVDKTPWWIECKRAKESKGRNSPKIKAGIEQAEKHTDGRPILIVSKADRKPVYVTMTLESFLSLIEKPLTNE